MATKRPTKPTAPRRREPQKVHVTHALEAQNLTLTVRMPGLEGALIGMVSAAMEHAQRDTATSHTDDAARLKLAQASQALDEDRQKLAWAEHNFRVREWEEKQKLLAAGKSTY